MLEKLKIKRQELEALCEAVKPIKGVHIRGCESVKISYSYSKQIRSGDKAYLGTQNNLILLTQMVNAYRKEFAQYVKNIKTLEHETLKELQNIK